MPRRPRLAQPRIAPQPPPWLRPHFSDAAHAPTRTHVTPAGAAPLAAILGDTEARRSLLQQAANFTFTADINKIANYPPPVYEQPISIRYDSSAQVTNNNPKSFSLAAAQTNLCNINGGSLVVAVQDVDNTTNKLDAVTVSLNGVEVITAYTPPDSVSNNSPWFVKLTANPGAMTIKELVSWWQSGKENRLALDLSACTRAASSVAGTNPCESLTDSPCGARSSLQIRVDIPNVVTISNAAGNNFQVFWVQLAPGESCLPRWAPTAGSAARYRPCSPGADAVAHMRLGPHPCSVPASLCFHLI